MKNYYSKMFYHRDELTEWLNYNQSSIVLDIVWIGNCWILFYYTLSN